MHGRVKVKSTAQQAEEKRIERAKRLAVYNAAMDAIFNKRTESSSDEELLKLTARVLQENPDDATLWNIRREFFLETKSKGEDLTPLVKDELYLVQQALMKNPKSYGAWFHRGWVNENMTAEADWTRELQLCNLFLEKDDRNFHCWDYRRFVLIKKPNPLEDELKFSKEKIVSNFSNYSSWHFRSKLLPLMFPDRGDGNNHIEETVLLEELDLVLNAAFTDPQDQSAWMYHRWLLGKAKPEEGLLLSKWLPARNLVIIAFQKPVLDCCIAVETDKRIDVRWKPIGGQTASYVWIAIDKELGNSTSRVTVDNHQLERNELWTNSDDLSSDLLTAPKTAVLEEQLENAKTLATMEPECKWPLLTSILLMIALKDSKYEEEISESLQSLTTIDPKRKNYYHDLRSKLILDARFKEIKKSTVDLKDLQLTCLRNCHRLAFVQSLNLEGNALTSDRLNQLKYCPLLEDLNIGRNPVRDLDFLENVPNIKRLSLVGCKEMSCFAGLRYLENQPILTLDEELDGKFGKQLREHYSIEVLKHSSLS